MFKPIDPNGFTTVVRNSATSRARFNGLRVSGTQKDGSTCWRTLYVSRHAPEWFGRLADEYANTFYEIQVTVVALYHGLIAFVGPVAETEAEAREMAQKRLSAPQTTPRPSPPFPKNTAAACAIHELVAKSRGLTIVRHEEWERLVVTFVVDAEQKQYRISGGTIVGKLQARIDSGETTQEKEIQRFVKLRPVSSFVAA